MQQRVHNGEGVFRVIDGVDGRREGVREGRREDEEDN